MVIGVKWQLKLLHYTTVSINPYMNLPFDHLIFTTDMEVGKEILVYRHDDHAGDRYSFKANIFRVHDECDSDGDYDMQRMIASPDNVMDQKFSFVRLDEYNGNKLWMDCITLLGIPIRYITDEDQFHARLTGDWRDVADKIRIARDAYDENVLAKDLEDFFDDL